VHINKIITLHVIITSFFLLFHIVNIFSSTIRIIFFYNFIYSEKKFQENVNVYWSKVQNYSWIIFGLQLFHFE